MSAEKAEELFKLLKQRGALSKQLSELDGRIEV